MSVVVRDDIYPQIAQQFPALYKENGQVLIEFVKAYYEHLDATMDRNIPKLRDIDTTLAAFVVYFKKKYLAELPIDTATDIRFILKHIKDLYTRKGTKEGLELLFRMFFDQEIEVFYPSTSILRPSDSVWGGDTYLEMLPVYSVDDYPIQKGMRIRGDISLATGFVDDIIFVNFGGSLSPILYLSNITGTFSSDDSLLIVTLNENSIELTTNVGKLIAGSINQVNVQDVGRLASQNIGDKVSLVSSIRGTEAQARVTKTKATATGSITFGIEDGGFGYVDPNSVSASNNIGISNRVMIVNSGNTPDSASYVDFKAGDIIFCSAEPIVYDGSTANGAQQYYITGSAEVIAYNHPLLFVRCNTLAEQIAFRQLDDAGGDNVFDKAFNFVTDPTNPISLATKYTNAMKAPNYVASISTNRTDLEGDDDNDVTDTLIQTKLSLLHSDASSYAGIVLKNNSNAGLVNAVKNQFMIYGRLGFTSDFLISNGLGYNGILSDFAENPIAFPTVQNPTFSITRTRGDSRADTFTNETTTVTSLGTFNDSASFEIGSIKDEETVSFVTDQVGDFASVVLNAGNTTGGTDGFGDDDDYGMSGPGAENLGTRIADAFNTVTAKIGSIDSINVLARGDSFQNDVAVHIVNQDIAKFDKKDIILTFDVVDFELTVGDIITQERELPDIEINQAGNIDEAGIEAIPASTTGPGYTQSVTTFDYITGNTIPYTTRAKFIKRVDNQFYFRPLSFHGFELGVPVVIDNNEKTISDIGQDAESLPIGANAVIRGRASFESGQIDEVVISKTGYRYSDGETVDIVNIEPDSVNYNKVVAKATVRTLGQGRTAGRWKSKTSFVSESSKKIHDNDYYQEYSYDVSSIVNPVKYKPLIDDIVGVSGTKLFSTPLINSINEMDSDLDVAFTYYDVGSSQLITHDGVDNITVEDVEVYSPIITSIEGHIAFNTPLVILNDDGDLLSDGDKLYIVSTSGQDLTGFTSNNPGTIGLVYIVTDVSYANNGEAVAGFKLLSVSGGPVTTVIDNTLSDANIFNYTTGVGAGANLSSFVATPNLHADIVTQTGTS